MFFFQFTFSDGVHLRSAMNGNAQLKGSDAEFIYLLAVNSLMVLQGHLMRGLVMSKRGSFTRPG